VLGLLRSACAGTRAGARAHLLAGGLGAPVVDWLLTSWVGTRDEGRFAFDLDAISAELQDTLSSDLWPAVDCGPARVLLVEAGRGGRWTPAERARARRSPTVRFETLPDAGHWLQVDAPDKLGALLDAWIGP
jgi:pimeloyl-ACP methyl ester carboxylesterase